MCVVEPKLPCCCCCCATACCFLDPNSASRQMWHGYRVHDEFWFGPTRMRTTESQLQSHSDHWLFACCVALGGCKSVVKLSCWLLCCPGLAGCGHNDTHEHKHWGVLQHIAVQCCHSWWLRGTQAGFLIGEWSSVCERWRMKDVCNHTVWHSKS